MYCIVLVSEQKDMIIDRKRQKRAVMIRLENVCFAYEKEIALRYVDLHINRGDSIVIPVSYTHLKLPTKSLV